MLASIRFLPALGGAAISLPAAAQFSDSRFLPHGICIAWQPNLLALHVISDALIAAAYFSIPFALFYFVRHRRDLPFHWVFVLFGVFITSCGITHVIDIWTLWQPDYWLDGIAKAITALASVPTAIATILLLPLALRLPSTRDLEHANATLAAEVAQRTRAQSELLAAREELERVVKQRTADLDRVAGDLAETNAILETLFEKAPIGLGLWDTALRFVRVNDALARINGLPREAHLGRTVSELLPQLDPGVMRCMQRALDGEAVVVQETSGMTPAQPGVQRWWAVNYYPVKLDRRTIGVGATCEEITEKKNLEAQRVELLEMERLARREAEAANRSKDEFLATVSHELRNPLQAIIGWMQILQHASVDDATRRHAIERVVSSAHAQARLVEDMLDASRIVTGKLRLAPRRCDLAALVQGTAESLRGKAREREIDLRVRVSARIDAEVDPERMQQVVWNLLTNALKFTPIGGRVEADLTQDGEEAVLQVRDNGQGIGPAFLPLVFEPFRQADGGKGHSGLGLGLAITRHIVELHRGTVSAHSDGIGRGATFTVRIPLAWKGTAVRDVDASVSPHDRDALNGARILVVDDEADPREVLGMLLRQAGATVRVCASAAEARTALAEFAPELVISDIGMPDEDGLRFMRGVATPEQRPWHAIALSAYARPQDRAAALDAGFDLHLAKPVDRLELLAAVRRVLNR